jgi:hypothetical protein
LARHQQVEQNRAPAVLPDHPGLARRPLTSHQAVVELIGATTTCTGLTVTAELDTSEYATGLIFAKKQVEVLPIDRHGFHRTGTTQSGQNLMKRPSLPGSRRHADGRPELFIFNC